MNAEKFLIAGGNPTILVWDCPPYKQVAISKQLLESSKAEQVGFITTEKGVMYLTMMGNELCINATLALASVSGDGGKFFTRGIDYLVSYSKNEWTTVELRLPFRQEGNTVLFDGIGYSCYTGDVVVTKEQVIDLAKKYNQPAFGIIVCKGNTITPHVYVAQTGSLIAESACGSGSIAASIVLGSQDIVQPSGETIKIKRNGFLFSVSARVRVIPNYESDLDINISNSQYAKNFALNNNS